MSGPTERRVLRRATRRLTASMLLAGAVAIAALSTTGAEARSQAPPANVSLPTISGMAVTGETLTASEGSWTGAPFSTTAFAWLRCDPAGLNCALISGATLVTYIPETGDVGNTLRVQVTKTNAEGPVSARSDPTAVVTTPSEPVNTAEPLISGTPVEGSTLSTTNGTWTAAGSITYTYQWLRCDASGGLPNGSDCPTIPGATSSSYTLTDDEIGRRLRVQVTASTSAGSNTATSNPTDVITQSTTTGPPRNTVEPSISGVLAVGRALFASVGTWSGEPPITFSYQWVRCGGDGGLPDGSNCTFISGATTSSYIPSTDDVGSPLRVRITATNSLGTETVASNATAAIQASSTTVGPSAPRNTFLPVILGSPAVGTTLTATNGVWTGTAPLLYSYQWRRCDADGGSSTGLDCAVITGATGTQYVPTAADLGRRLRVQVTARNTLGTTVATSNATALVQAAGSGTTPPPPPTSPPPPANLPPGAIRLPAGLYSVPVTSVSPPQRLVAGAIDFVPDTVRSRTRPFVLRVRVLDTRGFAIRDALVFVRSTPLVTSSPGEARTGRDGWASVQLRPRASFPLGTRVQFFIRVRKQSDQLLEGVSNRRLVQVATARG